MSPEEASTSANQATGFNFSSPSVQNQIHELAKTLPPPRKQNTACDACRSRKVKCNQIPGQDKCQHCQAKNYPCTHHAQQATSEKKRHAAQSKRPRSNSSSLGTPGPSRTAETSHSRPTPYPLPLPRPLQSPPAQNAVPHHPVITTHTPTRDLLAYLFSPPDPSELNGNANGHIRLGSRASSVGPGAYAEWGELAYQLEGERFRAEFAQDLVEVFFQIVHTRLPLLNPSQFRARFKASLQPSFPRDQGLDLNERRSHSPASSYTLATNSGHNSPKNGMIGASEYKPIHNALVATVVAWGAKFSEHPLLLADRERNKGQGALPKFLIYRARELAEELKVHRVPSADHVVISLLIEPLQSQNPEGGDGFHGFWLTSAIRLLLDLGINHKSVMSNIEDDDARGTMIFAWWMACLADAYRSVYYRRKPLLDDDDYDIDFYTVGPVPTDVDETQTQTTPSPREQLEFLGYYRAAHALARIARQMSRQLWRPATESDGIQKDVLHAFMLSLGEWREEHLARVGVPSNFQSDWDFVSAVTACASDATYHIMWIILFNALDDFGVREVNDVVRTGSSGTVLQDHAEIESMKKRMIDEALHGALRIAGLAGVLTTNGYLRLDSAVMHVSCIQAGTLLARLGRPEVVNCINGLEQYSHAYEECAESAAEIKRLYAQAASGECDLNHMASVAPTFRQGFVGQTMVQNGATPSPQHIQQQLAQQQHISGNGLHMNGNGHHHSHHQGMNMVEQSVYVPQFH